MMNKIGISQQIIEGVEIIYREIKIRIVINKRSVEECWTSRSLTQWSIKSCVVLDIYIYGKRERLHEMSDDRGSSGRKKKIYGAAYADLVMVAKTEEDG